MNPRIRRYRQKMSLLNKFLNVFKSKTFHPSMAQIEKKFLKYLDFQNGFFIEVGAHDGYTQSNTYFLEKHQLWRGLLIEHIQAGAAVNPRIEDGVLRSVRAIELR